MVWHCGEKIPPVGTKLKGNYAAHSRAAAAHSRETGSRSTISRTLRLTGACDTM
jgi:hypothetical protein